MNLTVAVIDVQKKKSPAEDHGDGHVDGGSKVIVIAIRQCKYNLFNC